MALPDVSLSWQFQVSGGVLGTFGTATTYGHLDVADEQMLREVGIVGARYTYTYPTGDLSGLTEGSSLVVTDADGTDTTYDVRSVLRRADGTTVAALAES